MFLEINEFYGRVARSSRAGIRPPKRSKPRPSGPPLKRPPRNAAVYYAVALMLLADGELDYTWSATSRCPALPRAI